MRIMEFIQTDNLVEVNTNTLRGSEGPGLPQFRRYLLKTLKRYKSDFSTIYIIGSWYGNLSLMIAKDPRIMYDKIINVEIDNNALSIGDSIRKRHGFDDIIPLYCDANTLDYVDLDSDSLVINQSCIDMTATRWFKNIPSGTMICMTARNNAPKAINKFNSLRELANLYPLHEVLYCSEKQFVDPETEFSGYLLLGIK